VQKIRSQEEKIKGRGGKGIKRDSSIKNTVKKLLSFEGCNGQGSLDAKTKKAKKGPQSMRKGIREKGERSSGFSGEPKNLEV